MIILNSLMIGIYYKLTSKLIKQGFWYIQLCYFFKVFHKIFSKYNYGVSKHINEGVCLL